MELDFRRNPEVLNAIVDELDLGVFTVDAKGRFVAWSHGAERITGYAAKDVVGQPCEILEGEQCRGFAQLEVFLREGGGDDGKIARQECKIIAKNGRELFIHGSAKRVFNEARELVGAVGAFADLTEFVTAREKIAVLERHWGKDSAFATMIGESPSMREVIRQLTLAADSDVTVYVGGESGTGKELAANAIHNKSARRAKPFIAINCSAIPETLLESELFGHVKGAFTDAISDKLGVFEAAEGGTLFLDEIGDISPAIQVKLLRVLQEREIRRVGEMRTRPVNVRLITASHRDLKRLVVQGGIREDFFYRIHVFAIRLPPLRERREDIPLLVQHFIDQLGQQRSQPIEGISREALQLLMDYHWPGNVRQLRNAIEHACVTTAGDRISYLDLPPELRDPHSHSLASVADDLSRKEVEERERIIDALRQTGGNRTKAAELLGVSRVTLWKKMGRYAIEVPS